MSDLTEVRGNMSHLLRVGEFILNILHNKMGSHHPSQPSLTTTPNQMSYKDNIDFINLF